MKGFYYLNFSLFAFYLSLICLIVEGGILTKNVTNFAKRILSGRSLPFEDCGSKYLILNLSLSSCTTIPCVMDRGSTVEVNVLFDDESDDTTYLKHRVRWIFNTIKTRAKVTPDFCNGLHKCLSSNSEGKSFTASISVTNSLPVLSGAIIWEAVNEYEESVVCFRLPVIITAK